MNNFEELFKPYMTFINGEVNNAAFDLSKKEETFELFEQCFDFSFGSIEIDENLISIHTSGWSDNEECIRYFKKTLWWSIYHIASFSGGHYYFDLKKVEGEKHWTIIKTEY